MAMLILLDFSWGFVFGWYCGGRYCGSMFYCFKCIINCYVFLCYGYSICNYLLIFWYPAFIFYLTQINLYWYFILIYDKNNNLLLSNHLNNYLCWVNRIIFFQEKLQFYYSNNRRFEGLHKKNFIHLSMLGIFIIFDFYYFNLRLSVYQYMNSLTLLLAREA